MFWVTAFKSSSLARCKGRRERRKGYLDKAGMRAPPVDDTPLDVSKIALAASPEQLIQRAACCRTAVLRVLRERNRPLHAVFLHPPRRLTRERIRVPEGNVVLMRCRLRRELVEETNHALALDISPLQDRRPTPDVGVLLFDLRGPTARNERGEVFLHGEGDEVAVQEEIGQKVFGFRDLVKEIKWAGEIDR
jgi:hypothetical protein